MFKRPNRITSDRHSSPDHVSTKSWHIVAISNRKGRLLILTLLFAYIVITIVTNCLKTVFVGVTHFIVFCLLVALALYLLIYKQYYRRIVLVAYL